MNPETAPPGSETDEDVSYEVRTGGGLITLELQRTGRRMAFSTDRSSALTMASDLLRAVRHAEAWEEAERPVTRDRTRR